jgi:hypothetical protein
MGIRINKILGYGITDFSGFEDDLRISRELDERINSSEYDAAHFREYVYTYLRKTDWHEDYGNLIWNFYFDDRLSTKERNFFNSLRGLDSDDLFNSFVTHDTENDSNVLLVTNPIYKNWSRHDDTIDYYEENGIAKERVKILPNGIYPMNSLYNDIRDGGRIDCQIVHTIQHILGEDVDIELKNTSTSELLKATTFKNMDEYKLYCRPLIDEVVLMYLQFIGMFKSEFNVKSFWPMLYTYWR